MRDRRGTVTKPEPVYLEKPFPSDARSGISTIAEHANRELRTSETLRRRTPIDKVDALCLPIEADRAEADGVRMLKAPANLVGSADTEIAPAIAGDAKPSNVRRYYTNTLEQPNMISVDASEDRAALATAAGVLSLALDASVTTKADNSVEKMMAHECAALHHAGMTLLAMFQSPITNLPMAEAVRCCNGAVRAFEGAGYAALVLQKLQTGGAQRVVVQHQQVNVGHGGQAVVAGRISRGSRKRRGRRSK